MRIPTGFEQSLSHWHPNPIESHKTRHSPGFRYSVVSPPSSFMLSVCPAMIVLGSLHTLCETLHDGSESRDQNHGPPWHGRGLTETGTNLVFRFLAKLWVVGVSGCWCLASLICWNSSPWSVTNVHWRLSARGLIEHLLQY